MHKGERSLARAAVSITLSALAACDKAPDTAARADGGAQTSGAAPAASAHAAPPDAAAPVASAHVATNEHLDAAVEFKPAPPTAYSTAVLAAKPVAYYRFEEESGDTFHSDVGGQKYDALIKGNVTRVPGALGANGGRAVHFSGAGGAIDAGRNFALGSKEFAVEVWIRPAPRDKAGHRVFSSGTGGKGSYFLGWDGASKASPSGSGLYFGVALDNSGVSDVSDPPEPPARTWTHLLVEGGGPDLFFYTNGARSQSGQVDLGNPKPGAAKFMIGADALGAEVFDGDIDELAIYDHGFDDDATIKAHFVAASHH